MAAVIIVLTAVVGCKNAELESAEWKQAKISALYQDYAREFPLVEGINVQKLQQLQQGEEIVLVDVRSPVEIAVSMIPGAITKAEFERNFEQNPEQYQNSTIVAYCTIGYRSGQYADLWRAKNLKILNLEGSLLAWSHIKGKLVNSTGTTNKVHVFGRQWQLTADGYQSVW